MKKKHWYDYLWIVSPIYLGLGFFNIMYAWLGLIFFCTPILISVFGGGKLYCNRYCDRGQLLTLLGSKLKLSRNRPTPAILKSPWFRYGFLIFFFAMFFQMLGVTWMVFEGTKDMAAFVKLLWTFKVPWQWACPAGVTPWMAQFAYGFYSMMLTSTLISIVMMVFFKPRTWCVFCPMGTFTHLISRLRAGKAPEPQAGCSGNCSACTKGGH